MCTMHHSSDERDQQPPPHKQINEEEIDCRITDFIRTNITDQQSTREITSLPETSKSPDGTETIDLDCVKTEIKSEFEEVMILDVENEAQGYESVFMDEESDSVNMMKEDVEKNYDITDPEEIDVKPDVSLMLEYGSDNDLGEDEEESNGDTMSEEIDVKPDVSLMLECGNIDTLEEDKEQTDSFTNLEEIYIKPDVSSIFDEVTTGTSETNGQHFLSPKRTLPFKVLLNVKLPFQAHERSKPSTIQNLDSERDETTENRIKVRNVEDMLDQNLLKTNSEVHLDMETVTPETSEGKTQPLNSHEQDLRNPYPTNTKLPCEIYENAKPGCKRKLNPGYEENGPENKIKVRNVQDMLDLGLAKDESSDSSIVRDNSDSGHVKDYDSRHVCLFCQQRSYNMFTHLSRFHSDKLEFTSSKSLTTSGRRRNLIYAQRVGDFQHNAKVIKNNGGEIVVLRLSEKFIGRYSIKHFLPCPDCAGYVFESYLKSHHRCCYLKPKSGKPVKNRDLLSESLAMQMYSLKKGESNLKETDLDYSSFKCLGEKDDLIYLFGEHKVGMNDSKDLSCVLVEMLKLNSLLMSCRQISHNPNLAIKDLLVPEYVHVILSYVICMRNNYLESYERRTSLYSLIVIVCFLWRGKCLLEGQHLLAEKAMTFYYTFAEDWEKAVGFSSEPLLFKPVKNGYIPLASEVIFAKDTLKYTIKALTSSLKREVRAGVMKQLWKCLADTTFCLLCLFNPVEFGAIEGIKISEYAVRPDWTIDSPDPFKMITNKMTFHMASSRTIFTTVYKFEENVLLLSPEMKQAIDILIRRREAASVKPSNPYIFGLPCDDRTTMKAEDCFENVFRKNGVLKNNVLKKCIKKEYISFVTQVSEMTFAEIEWTKKYLAEMSLVNRNNTNISYDVLYRIIDVVLKVNKTKPTHLNICIEEANFIINDYEEALKVKKMELPVETAVPLKTKKLSPSLVAFIRSKLTTATTKKRTPIVDPSVVMKKPEEGNIAVSKKQDTLIVGTSTVMKKPEFEKEDPAVMKKQDTLIVDAPTVKEKHKSEKEDAAVPMKKDTLVVDAPTIEEKPESEKGETPGVSIDKTTPKHIQINPVKLPTTKTLQKGETSDGSTDKTTPKPIPINPVKFSTTNTFQTGKTPNGFINKIVLNPASACPDKFFTVKTVQKEETPDGLTKTTEPKPKPVPPVKFSTFKALRRGKTPDDLAKQPVPNHNQPVVPVTFSLFKALQRATSERKYNTEWTDLMRKYVLEFFREDIKNRKVPGKVKCLTCICMRKTLMYGRSWEDVKNFVKREINLRQGVNDTSIKIDLKEGPEIIK